MKVSFASSPGSAHKPNEDFVAANPRVALILDGLSSPPELGTGCVHGTPWFVARLSAAILHEATNQPQAPLTDCVARAITTVAAAHGDTCDLTHLGTPSSSVALIREGPDTVDYLSIFDSVILLDGPAGLTFASDRRVDGYAREEHKQTQAHRIGTREHQQAVTDLVAAQRPHRNVASGYWVAAAKPDAAHNALTGSVPRAAVTRAAIMSDGAACLAELYGRTDWQGMLDLLGAEGPQHVIDRCRETEATDPEGVRWPRYKAGDDATAAFCEFDGSAA